MMSATADSVVPVDFRGNPLSLEQIKELIRQDVAELSRLYSIKALDDARRQQDQIHLPNRRLLNMVEMWEQAHDLHWAWYRARFDAGTEGS